MKESIQFGSELDWDPFGIIHSKGTQRRYLNMIEIRRNNVRRQTALANVKVKGFTSFCLAKSKLSGEERII